MNASIVIPLFNESGNVGPLYSELVRLMEREPRVQEIIFVDDGSRDTTFAQLKEFCAPDPKATIIRLRRNFGQTAAMSAGFDAAQGDVIVAMDGDRQNDPADVPRLLDMIEEGYDVVSGWRKDRKDKWLTRRVPSWIANRLISKITSVPLHDYGCSLKAYRREVIQGVKLYGEMHRFIPSLTSWMGVNVAEIVVNHRPRVAGKSKYGLSRIIRVVLDLINVKFLISYSTRPIQVFGKIGVYAFLLGTLFALITLYMKLFQSWDVTGNPFFMLSVLSVLISVQFICIGLLGEINIRTYYELQQKPTYVVREVFRGGAHVSSRQ